MLEQAHEYLDLVLVVSLLFGMMVTIGGITVRLARRYADQLADEREEAVIAEVKTAISEALEPIRVELKAVAGEVSRIAVLEQEHARLQATIHNGITDRQKRIEVRVDEIASHLMWDGEERRNVD